MSSCTRQCHCQAISVCAFIKIYACKHSLDVGALHWEAANHILKKYSCGVRILGKVIAIHTYIRIF